jgi:hypothetical protein
MMQNPIHEPKEIHDKVLHLYNSYTRLLSLDKIFEKILKEIQIDEDKKEEFKHKM